MINDFYKKDQISLQIVLDLWALSDKKLFQVVWNL